MADVTLELPGVPTEARSEGARPADQRRGPRVQGDLVLAIGAPVDHLDADQLGQLIGEGRALIHGSIVRPGGIRAHNLLVQLGDLGSQLIYLVYQGPHRLISGILLLLQQLIVGLEAVDHGLGIAHDARQGGTIPRIGGKGLESLEEGLDLRRKSRIGGISEGGGDDTHARGERSVFRLDRRRLRDLEIQEFVPHARHGVQRDATAEIGLSLDQRLVRRKVGPLPGVARGVHVRDVVTHHVEGATAGPGGPRVRRRGWN